jgi:hypothetical protein
MDDEPARIGTVYQDPETGEYVMPADFAGDKELRWRPEDEIPADDAPEDYEVVSVSRTYRAPIPPPVPETGTISLDEQVRLYEERFERELDRLWDALADPVYVRHIHDLGLSRLKAGFLRYDDMMYHWSDACRQSNQDEELADYIVYGTSEP